jgi:beta-lactamase regulating signal transducer with metallopeptidase domain
MTRLSAARKHLLITALLAASIAAPLAWLSRARVTIEVPWWREAPVASPFSSPLPAGDAIMRAKDVTTLPPPREPADIPGLLVWLWLAGAAFVVLRMARQAAVVRAIRQRSSRTAYSELGQDLCAARHAIGYGGRVELRTSTAIDVPCVTGLVRPAILLPAAVIEWTAAERHSVLAHELAHLTRHDLWTRAIAQAACALHWFNPLAWRLAAAAERAAELAADDLALGSGILPSTYAEALLSVVEQMTVSRSVGLAFARRSTLESRIRGVLEPARERSGVTSRARAILLATSGLAAATLACVRLSPRSDTSLAPFTAASTSRVVSDSAARAQTPLPGARPAPRSRIASAPTAPASRRTTSAAPAPAPAIGTLADTVAAAESLASATTDWVDEAAAGLVALLDDPSSQVRATAANSLRRFDDPKSSAAVDHALAAAFKSRDMLDRVQQEKVKQ